MYNPLSYRFSTLRSRRLELVGERGTLEEEADQQEEEIGQQEGEALPEQEEIDMDGYEAHIFGQRRDSSSSSSSSDPDEMPPLESPEEPRWIDRMMFRRAFVDMMDFIRDYVIFMATLRGLQIRE